MYTKHKRTPENLHELELVIENLKWDIVGISKMRRLGERIDERNRYIMYLPDKEGFDFW